MTDLLLLPGDGIGPEVTAQVRRIASRLVHPEVYRAVGLDPKQASKVAKANPHHRESLRWTARKLVPFLREQGMIGGLSEALWRRSALI